MLYKQHLDAKDDEYESLIKHEEVDGGNQETQQIDFDFDIDNWNEDKEGEKNGKQLVSSPIKTSKGSDDRISRKYL